MNLSRWTTARHVLAAFDAEAAWLTDVMAAIAREASRLRLDREPGRLARARATILDAAIARAVASQARRRRGHAAAARRSRDVEDIATRGERAAEQAAMALETLYLATGSREVPARRARVRRAVPAVPESRALRSAPVHRAGEKIEAALGR